MLSSKKSIISRKNNLNTDKTQLKFLAKKVSFQKILPILLSILVFVIVLGIRNLTMIRVVSCLFNQEACPSINNIDVKDIKNQNLITVDTEKIKNNILNTNPMIGNVAFTKKYPNTLIIQLMQRNPKYVLITPEQTFALDGEGMTMNMDSGDLTGDLVPIESNESFALGQKIVSPTVLSAMKLTDLLANSGLRVRSISTLNIGDIQASLVDGLILRFSGQRDLVKQVDSIKLILNQPASQIENKPKEIDVRFDDPVIR